MHSSDKNKTKSGVEVDSKTNMREFMIAILEDNNKAQRTVGYSDADIIEIFEQSVEFMALAEEVSVLQQLIQNLLQSSHNFLLPFVAWQTRNNHGHHQLHD